MKAEIMIPKGMTQEQKDNIPDFKIAVDVPERKLSLIEQMKHYMDAIDTARLKIRKLTNQKSIEK